jgi:D-glycero-D-manno-heptose 1,7-bisphosphate phosphatase
VRSAAYLDRDGVINAMVETSAGIDSPQRPEDFELLPGAAGAIRRLNDLGLAVVVVSNQPGIAKGKSSPALLSATTDLLHAKLAAEGAAVDAVYYCLHHPDAVVSEYKAVCDCRKPRPGMLLAAAAEHDLDLSRSWMVGDQDRDIEAGRSAGVETILVGSATMTRRDGTALPDHVGRDLTDAVHLIERRLGSGATSTRQGHAHGSLR